MTLTQCCSCICTMSRHWKYDVTTFGQCHDNVMTLRKLLELVSRHCCRCRCCDIEREFCILSRKFVLVFPILFLQFKFMLVNISLEMLKNLNSNMDSTLRFSIQSFKHIFITLQKFSQNYSTKYNQATM